MKVLVASSSCQQYEATGLNQPLRDTWLPALADIGWDYKFFHGEGAAPRADVVLVPCNDAYYDLTSKLRLKLKWALEQGYDYVFTCLADLYARPERLATCGFERVDYMGTTACNCPGRAYAQGGPGFFLSRRACETIVSARENYPNEDCYAADMLARVGISPTHNDDFRYAGPGPLKSNTVVSNHLSTQPGGYTAAGMYAEHERWIKS